MSKITHKTTAEEIIKFYNTDLTGKVAIVTGSNAGIGLETARVLALAGAKVIIPCRSQEKADGAVNHIKKSVPEADLVPMIIDLSDLSSVRNFAQEFLALNLPLHILVNNAGCVGSSRVLTKDGFEWIFAVNHLGHFLLVELLRNKIKESAPSRIVIVSSAGQLQFLASRGIDFDNLNGEKYFGTMYTYSQSKLANVYHVKELQRQFDAEGVDVTVTALHPGFVLTDIGKGSTTLSGVWDFMKQIRLTKMDWLELPKNTENGASTSIFCAVAPEIKKGEYYNNNAAYPQGLNEQANNKELAKKMWDISEQYITNGHP
ncbi:unnamed protein product [Mucor hiemalis]